jgi:hypothetical protein
MFVKRLSAKYNKLLLELEFLYTDLQYHEEVLQEASTEFREAFSSYCSKQGVDIKKEASKERFEKGEEKPEEAEDDIRDIDKKNKPADIKKIFKLIATKTHPDMFATASEEEQKKNNEIFLEAKEAAESNDFFRLYKIAKDLGLEVVPTMSQVKLLQEEAMKLKNNINKMQNMLAWVWYEEENEAVREKLLEKYKDIVLN